MDLSDLECVFIYKEFLFETNASKNRVLTSAKTREVHPMMSKWGKTCPIVLLVHLVMFQKFQFIYAKKDNAS